MKNVLLRMLTLFAVAVMCFATSVGQNSEDVRHFDYDKSAPLDIKTIGTQQNENATVYDITYASPKGGVVPAYLVVPKGPGKCAAVIWDIGTGATPRCEIERSFSTKQSR